MTFRMDTDFGFLDFNVQEPVFHVQEFNSLEVVSCGIGIVSA